MTDSRENLVLSLPVLFVDEVLPGLKDTELRVLLVVLRQIRVTGRERDSAWLTHGELKRRTGRAGEAVSAAIGSLAEAGFLVVRDESGRELPTAQERRSATGRRHYAITDSLRTGKAKTIDINTYKHYGLRFPDEVGTDSTSVKQRIEREKARIRHRLQKL